MSPREQSPVSPARAGEAPLITRMLRYGAGSVVATVSSNLTFLLVFGPLHASATWASILGWLAGAIPNYWLNRSWTWQRRGRPDPRRELLPYVAIILGTLLLAVLMTNGVDALLAHTGIGHATRTLLVTATFFGVYVVVFAIRFVLFERLFRGSAPSDEGPSR